MHLGHFRKNYRVHQALEDELCPVLFLNVQHKVLAKNVVFKHLAAYQKLQFSLEGINNINCEWNSDIFSNLEIMLALDVMYQGRHIEELKRCLAVAEVEQLHVKSMV